MPPALLRTARLGRRLYASQAARYELPLLRLPVVTFPDQAVSLRVKSDASVTTEVDTAAGKGEFPAMTVPKDMVNWALRESGGMVAAVGPCGHVGVELAVMFEDGGRTIWANMPGRREHQLLEAFIPTPPDVAHAVGGRRLRLLRSSCAEGEAWRQATVEPLEDDAVSERRRERLGDEAARALELVAAGLERGAFALESCTLDEELGAPACDPRSHPLYMSAAEQATPPASTDPAALSLWLASRLPLTTQLRMRLLACVCPLKRMTDVVDAMRLLLDPYSRRFEHRLRLHVVTPSGDNCAGVGAPTTPPKSFVGEAPPLYSSWSDENSFPHG